MATIYPNHNTPFKDTQTSIKLALSIGWTPTDIQVLNGLCYLRFDPRYPTAIRLFDYTDPHIIYNIAKTFDCFPSAKIEGNYLLASKNNRPTIIGWESIIWSYKQKKWKTTNAYIPELAIALAVINRDK